MSMNEVVKKLAKAIDSQADKAKPSAYDTPATVRRVEDGVAWVHIPGGVDETPVKQTIACAEGDSVQVRVSGGRAWIQGNATSPPTDDTTALAADKKATESFESARAARLAADSAESSAAAAKTAADAANDILGDMEDAATAAHTSLTGIYADAETAKTNAQTAITNAGLAQTAAENAQQSADSALVSLSTVEDVVGVLNWITAHGTMTLTSDVTVNPAHVYFVVDPAGDYVVGGTHYSIVSEPKDAELATYYELTVDESVQNYVATHIVVDTEGLWIVPDSGGNKVLIATGAGSSYTTAGTYIIGKVNGVDTVFAKFTAGGVMMQSKNGIQLANIGYGEALVQDLTSQPAPYYTFGKRDTTITPYSSSSTYDVGNLCVYNDKVYVCTTEIDTPEQWNSSHWQFAIGAYSVAEGEDNIASGYSSHAEGRHSLSVGQSSHAENNGYALGNLSHAEGGSWSVGNFSHAEGSSSAAQGDLSHAEGYACGAAGDVSHAQGYEVLASSFAQTALGKYNIEDNADVYAVIVGNGYFDSGQGLIVRSNALTVDWSGNVDIPSGASYKINGTALVASDVGAEPTLTNISKNGSTYSGGIEDEKLLTTTTINTWKTILGIS